MALRVRVIAFAGVATLGAVALLLYRRRRQRGEYKPYAYDVPPFKWPKTVAEIEAGTEAVLASAKANLDAVAGSMNDLTFERVIRPLMNSPNFKV